MAKEGQWEEHRCCHHGLEKMSSSLNSMQSSSSDNINAGSAFVAITAIVVGGIIVIAILIIRCVRKSKAQSNIAQGQIPSSNTATSPYFSSYSVALNIEMETIDRFLDDIMKEKPKRFTPQHLMSFTHNYANKLGSGGFGVVYKGQFPNGLQVAVKVLHGTLDKRTEEQFMAEIGTIGRTYHINLVRLYGFCLDPTVKALVYEYMENGSLDRYLFDENNRIEWGRLYEIAIGTAKGIRYLHEECEQKIIHYDIKPGNILLNANFCPKVADFGLAKLCDRENSHVTLTGGRGTPGYAAPELWMPLPVTHKCDVYSFGMLLFEIVGMRRNLEFKQGESQEWYPKWVWEKNEQGKLENVISLSGIEAKYREKAERMCRVALWCVQYQPVARPSMSNVVRMMEEEEEISAPLNPFQYMTSYATSSTQWSESEGESTSRKTTEDENVNG
ncbi:rust resistance kinase Lr10-like [Cocos nucifera]|uniref:Rust resistance kinase Lr10-like n=1 Tax=Cocos nucifera TaxID=13894 RepID=A0A8K0HT99_COCNU|nr:rust resistance kinase Lr10-like [Cocos nucifera]